MNYSIKTLVRLTIVSLSFATLMPGATTWAGPPDGDGCHLDHKECGGSGDDSSPSENLSAKFCLIIDETLDRLYIQSDGGSQTTDSDEYCADKKEKVAAGTGSGDGFRWDTNMQNTNKLQQWMRWRWVHMNIVEDKSFLPHAKDAVHAIDIFEIDFRFNQTVGLDLGSLDPQVDGVCTGTCDGQVAATIRYYAGKTVVGYDFKNYGILGFGAVNTPFPDDPADLFCLGSANEAGGSILNGGMIKVTRTSTTEWTLESPESGTACRFSLDAGGNKCTFTNERCLAISLNLPEQIDFDFKFTITQQD